MSRNSKKKTDADILVKKVQNFLPGTMWWCRHAQDARFLAVVVAGEEVLLAIPGEHGIGIEMVGYQLYVHTAREIRAAITGGRNGPGGELVFRVVGHELGAGRIDDLVKVIGMHRHVGKAKHRVDQRRPVENADRATRGQERPGRRV